MESDSNNSGSQSGRKAGLKLRLGDRGVVQVCTTDERVVGKMTTAGLELVCRVIGSKGTVMHELRWAGVVHAWPGSKLESAVLAAIQE